MLDLKTETFLCACRYKNYTRTAEELHITQSAVSQQIKNLEEYYGVPLFRYQNRVLSLTEEGVELQRYLETMHNDILKLRDSLQSKNTHQVLKVGTTMSIGDFYMPEYFVRFLKNNPEYRLNVTRLDTKQILDMLDNGALDFAFIEGDVSKSVYEVEPIKRDEIVAVCSKRYSIGRIDSVKDLFSHHLLIREKGSGTREIFYHYLIQAGYDLDSFESYSEFNSPLLIKKMLLAGCGISVLYKTVVEDCIQDGTLQQIKFSGFHLSHDFNAVWRKDSLYSESYHDIIEKMLEK